MLRELIEVVTGIVVTLNNYRSVRRNANIPTYKSNLWNYHCRFCTHLKNLIPHWENESLKYGTCHRVLLVKDFGLIDRKISNLARLLINGRSHAATVEIIYTVAVITKSAAGTGNMHLSIPLDCNESDRIDRIRIDSAYSRVLDDHLFEEMRTFHINESLIDSFGRLGLAVDLLYRLAAGTQISLCHEEIVIINEVYYFLLVIFSYFDPLTAEELAEKLIEFDLVIDKVRISRIVVSLNEVVITSSGDICISLGIREVIHLIKPVIHISGAELPSAMDHIEKYPHAGLPALLVDILNLGIHCLIVHTRNASYKIT